MNEGESLSGGASARSRQVTWDDRKRAIYLISAACWLAYLLIVVAIIAFTFPPYLLRHPAAFAIFLIVFVAPPAWIHYNWINNPAYLFVSGGIRRIRFSEQVQAQISRKKNFDNAFGVPFLPANLRTSAGSIDVRGSASDGAQVGPVQVVWDDYLLIATLALYPGRSGPKSTQTSRLEVGSNGLILAAGRWRPGVVLELPYSRIIGVWNGSDIKTIASGDVLVVVVDTGDDEVLFPFEIARRTSGVSKRATVDSLIRLINERRRR